MEKSTIARNQIMPLLDQLIRQLDAEGSATQRNYFVRIRGHLYGAQDDLSLSDSILKLTSSTAIGLTLSSTASVLVGRILEKTAELIDDLEGQPQEFH